MERRRVFRLIAILFTMWALLDMSAAEARNPRPPRRTPRRCHPGKVCRHGTGFCNDAGRCCDTMDGDVACGSNCCEPGQACCGGTTCADVQQDNNNCGGCGIVCSGGRSCQNGVCTCPDGRDDCPAGCVDTQSDNNNCGGCGGHCIGGTECQDGVCACPHTTDAICNDQCVNLLFDDANCGACGNACAASEKCFLGRCGCSDPAQLDCDGQCIDGFSDRNNCGAVRQRLRGGPGLRRRTVSAAMRRMPRAGEQRMRPEGHRQGHRLRRRLRRHQDRLEQLRVLRQRVSRQRHLPERRLHRRRLSRPVAFVRGGLPPARHQCVLPQRVHVQHRGARCLVLWRGDVRLPQPRRILLPGRLPMLR